jgi:AcrR family transcriptional regulator
MKRGKYELKKRAERQEETRMRITRATLELHETVGPALTTRSAIAERAGVGRPTVYSHFPDELSLGRACSALDMSENPLPDPDPWEAVEDPEERLRAALAEVYAFFRRREGLWTNIMRDRDLPGFRDDPDVREVMRPIFEHWGRMKETLVAGWEPPEGRAGYLAAAVGLALDFQTWRALVRREGLTDEQAIELMVGTVRRAVRR